MVLLTSRSPEETFRFGEEYGRLAPAGMVIGLIGELGAGKTQWVRGFAHGLGITDRVHSPTFTLANEYRSGRMPCYHLDLYRLETADQIHAAGLDNYFDPAGGVTVIEWFDRARSVIRPAGKLVIVQIGPSGRNDSERTIAYEDPDT